MKFKNCCMDFYKEKGLYVKKSTLSGYSSILKNIIIPKLGEIEVNKINNKKLQHFVFELIDDNHSIKYVKDITKVVIQILNNLMNEEEIPYFKINIKYPRTNNSCKRDKKSYSLEEAKKIISYCLNNLNEERRLIGILLGIEQGLRIGEICALKYRDINVDENILIINKTLQRVYDSFEKKCEMIESSPKTETSRRVLPISKDLKKFLKNGEPDNYILTNTDKPIEPRTYRKFYSKTIDKIGLKYVNPHGLRHTFASMLITNGVDIKTVSELLGHANVNTTLSIYTHSNIEAKTKAIKELENLYE